MQERFYRQYMEASGLVPFQVTIEETDLHISAKADYTEQARAKVEAVREDLKNYIKGHHEFVSSLSPVAVAGEVPDIVRVMASAARVAGVGPMAAVAGAIAEIVGRDILEVSDEVIVENGGDIFMATNIERTIGVSAGDSSLSNKVGIKIIPEHSPLGICTSAGTIGHSLSFGKADAVVALAPSSALADAAATALGNLVKDEIFDDALKQAERIPGLFGVVVIKKEILGVWGNINLVPLA